MTSSEHTVGLRDMSAPCSVPFHKQVGAHFSSTSRDPLEFIVALGEVREGALTNS